jgi:hypothetical protein
MRFASFFPMACRCRTAKSTDAFSSCSANPDFACAGSYGAIQLFGGLMIPILRSVRRTRSTAMPL